MNEDDGAATLILSIVPSVKPETQEPMLNVLWYSRDSFLHRETLSIGAELKNTGGKSGYRREKNGFSGLIDEFGIYRNTQNGESSIIESVYKKALEEEYGLDLRFAEGFDSYSLPENLGFTGEVSLQKGKAVIGPDAALRLPQLLLRNETADVRVEIFGAQPSEAGFVCRAEFPDTEIPAVTLDLLGSITVDGEEFVLPAFPNGKKMEFALIHNSEGIILKAGEEQVQLHNQPGGSVDVVFLPKKRYKAAGFYRGNINYQHIRRDCTERAGQTIGRTGRRRVTAFFGSG